MSSASPLAGPLASINAQQQRTWRAASAPKRDARQLPHRSRCLSAGGLT
jgi:hypothetical protein